MGGFGALVGSMMIFPSRSARRAEHLLHRAIRDAEDEHLTPAPHLRERQQGGSVAGRRKADPSPRSRTP